MAFTTFAIGLLPSYESAGNFALVSLTLLRLMQGFSVGGQMVGSFLVSVEGVKGSVRDLLSSLSLGSACGGTALGAFAVMLLKLLLSPEDVRAWGWRIPFWCAFLFAAGTLVIQHLEQRAEQAEQAHSTLLAEEENATDAEHGGLHFVDSAEQVASEKFHAVRSAKSCDGGDCGDSGVASGLGLAPAGEEESVTSASCAGAAVALTVSTAGSGPGDKWPLATVWEFHRGGLLHAAMLSSVWCIGAFYVQVWVVLAATTLNPGQPVTDRAAYVVNAVGEDAG